MNQKLHRGGHGGVVWLALCLLIPSLLFAHDPLKSTDKGMTGSPLDGGASKTCGSCHNSTSVVNQSPNANLTGISGTTYTPSTVYPLTLSVTTAGTGRNGFEITSENATAKKGTFATGGGTDVMIVSNSSWLGHRTAKSGNASWNFSWTAPAAGTGQVCFYIIVMAQSSSQRGPEWLKNYCYNEAAAAPPTITTQPTNQTVNVGQTASFSLTATGAGLSYQWQKAPSGSTVYAPITGATAASYTTPATASADNGSSFRCVVTNSGGSVTSNAAMLTVTTVPPSITTQPANQTVNVGQTATFAVSAAGSAPLSYQWQKAPSGSTVYANITGATAGSYTTPATASADNGSSFRCVVTNSGGSVTSNASTLTVNVVPPTVTLQPANQTVTEGQTATFSLTASGTPPLSYQWQMALPGSAVFNAVIGTTNSSYTTPAMLQADSGTKYRCVVTNAASSATSNAATLTVSLAAVPPSIMVQPLPQTVSAGQTAIFTITADGTAPLGYQWQKAPSGSTVYSTITGATAASYTTPAATLTDNGSNFRCLVTNVVGNATSNPATLTVGAAPPAITTQPGPLSTAVGQTATFSVTASGTLPLTYQWQKAPSGSTVYSNITGATAASYTTPATTLADNGSNYRCVVTNSAGTITSNAALLTVIATPPSITTQPVDRTVTQGQTAAFSLSVSGTPPFTYQWESAPSGSTTFSPISGAMNASYTTPATTLAASGSRFQCRVTNAAGSVTSIPATLTVTMPDSPAILVQPVDTTVSIGQTATFTVEVDNPLDPTLTYTWYRNDVAIPGTANGHATYTLPSVTSADSGSSFYCICANAGGPNISDTAMLLVTRPLQTPALANLRPFMSLTDTLRVDTTYTFPVSFYWTFTRIGSVQGSGTARKAGVPSTNTITARTSSYSSALPLSGLGLTPGLYQLNLIAADSSGSLSQAMNANITFLTADLGAARVYPNPWRSDRNSLRSVKFDNLTVSSKVQIFTVSGHHVKTLSGTPGTVSWDLTNDSGDSVASGIFIYLITDDTGQKVRGQLVIIQ